MSIELAGIICDEETPPETFGFDVALNRLKFAFHVYRESWDNGFWINLAKPEPGDTLNVPYFYGPGGEEIELSAADILAIDWRLGLHDELFLTNSKN